jgi:hypothetical protein
VCSFEQTAAERSSKISGWNACFMKMHKDAMNNIGQPAEPKPERVECAIVELLDIAERQGITPADFIQLLDSGMQISDFLAAMNPLEYSQRTLDCDS